MYSLEEILEDSTLGFFFETIHDDAGVHGISLLVANEHVIILKDSGFDGFIVKLFSGVGHAVCFDCRDAVMLGVEDKSIIDVSMALSCDNIYVAANKHIDNKMADELKIKMDEYATHVRASITTKIDLTKNSLLDIVPSRLFTSLYRIKINILKCLYDCLDDEQKKMAKLRSKYLRSLYEMERNGIRIIDFDATAPADIAFMNDAKKHRVDGFSYTKFSPNSTKTGRTQSTKGSLNCMTIPKTEVRSAIRSRFDGGLIVSIDLNAADYRCIVSAVGGELADLYSDVEDFHEKTVELIFGDFKHMKIRRDVVKYATHATNYGISINRLIQNTGLTRAKAEALLKKMRFMSEPIGLFREDLFSKSKAQGFVESIGGNRMLLNGDEHGGKILALYAQASCADVFSLGVISMHESIRKMESVDMFIVHDELVLDVKNSEIERIVDAAIKMELDMSTLVPGMRVNMRFGDDYWEVSR